MPEHRLSDIELEAVRIVKEEKTAWENAVVFVTEKVAFDVRNLIRKCQKNYWGIFDEPKDPTTGRDKVWVPLTEATVDVAVKNCDLDTKDITFVAKKPQSVGLAHIVRSAVRCALDRLGFGEILDDLIRRLAIEGTAVWKTLETTEDGKKSVQILNVPLLNVYIDPVAPSIQEAYRFTERSLMTVEDIKRMKGWLNTADLEPSSTLNRNESSLLGSSTTGTSKYVDVWELWGKVPKWLIAGKTEDKKKDNEDVEARLVVSGIETPGRERVHLIERNTKGKRPYEEAWYIRVPGRWYGRGVAEKLLMLQVWVNTVVNIRINRSYISQLGIFQVRAGSGITAQMLSRLAANGVVKVTKINEDIAQIPMQEASQASYKDEEIIKDWTQRVTSTFEVVTGENLPASTTATQTVVQSQNAASSFVLIKEGIGMFLKRWLARHFIPTLFKNLKAGEIVQITGDPDAVRRLDEWAVNAALYDQVSSANAMGSFLDPMQVELERNRALGQLRASGNDRYVPLASDLNPTEYDVEVAVTNESMDKGVMVQNLLAALKLVPQQAQTILEEVFDLMGLDPNVVRNNQGIVPQQNPQMLMQGMAPQGQTQNPTELVQEANNPIPAAV